MGLCFLFDFLLGDYTEKVSFVGVLECSDNTGESTKGEKSFFVVSGV